MNKYKKPRIVQPSKPEPPIKPGVKIAVSMPVYGDFKAAFGYSYGKMMLYTGSSLVAAGLADMTANMIEGTYLDMARNDLTIQAMKTDCTHVLWLDCDMKFPEDSLLRLLMHNKDIVGANYPKRRFPIQHTAFKSVSTESTDLHVRCRTTPESTGLELVDAIGFGLLLMKTTVFEKLDYPWFKVDPTYGEDVRFCLNAKEKGIEVYVDHDLSKEVAHFGNLGFTYLHAEQWRAEMEAQEQREHDQKEAVA